MICYTDVFSYVSSGGRLDPNAYLYKLTCYILDSDIETVYQMVVQHLS